MGFRVWPPWIGLVPITHDWMLDPRLIWGAWTPGQRFGFFVVFIKLFLDGFYRGVGHVVMFVEAVLL